MRTSKGPIFEEQTLESVQAWAAFLQGAKLNKANLRGGGFEFARLSGAKLIDADLRAANFEMAWFAKADLTRANLTNANVQEAKFYDANFKDAVMDGVFKRYAIFQGAYMEGCELCPHDW